MLASLFFLPGHLPAAPAALPDAVVVDKAAAAQIRKPSPSTIPPEPQPEAKPGPGSSPAELLRRAQDLETPTGRELLAPASRVWAGAPALVLARQRPEVLLAEGVIAHSGTGRAAAAARADGTILVFAPGNGTEPTRLAMPEGHPAFALGLSADGGVLAAWAQGKGEIVFFDLAPALTQGRGGSPMPKAVRLAAPLHGDAALTLSSDGQTLAAHDDSGALWAGVRGGEMRPLGTLPGKPAALGFSSGGGVLVAVDSSGAGMVWNPRSGKAMRRFQVAGGPFVRGDFPSYAQGGQAGQGGALHARLWTARGELVRWDLLADEPAPDPGVDPGVEGGTDHNEPQAAQASGGLLELRGTGLFYVAEGLAWRTAPNYEPLSLALSWSRAERCLRLQDLDGQVRYYSSESGAPRPQCFAADWSSVPIRADGTAAIPGLELRVFDTAGQAPDGSPVYCRAISGKLAHLWSGSPPGSPASGPGAGKTTNSGSIAVSQSVAEGSAASTALAIPLRLGLAASAGTQALRVGR